MSRQQYVWQEVNCPFCKQRKTILVYEADEETRRRKRRKPPRKECDDCYCSRISAEQAAKYILWRNAVCPD